MELDKENIEKIKNNDRRTVLELYRYTFNALMGSAVRYKNNQEDQMVIVNNCFLKIVKNIDKYKIGTAYFSWVKRIAHNEIIDTFRKEKNYKELFNHEVDETIINVEETSTIDKEFEEEELLAMLNELPPATKIVFNLFAIDGYSYNEIAEQLGIGKETVKWHLKSARKKLRAKLTKVKTN